jgi:hypothetical protein
MRASDTPYSPRRAAASLAPPAVVTSTARSPPHASGHPGSRLPAARRRARLRPAIARTGPPRPLPPAVVDEGRLHPLRGRGGQPVLARIVPVRVSVTDRDQATSRSVGWGEMFGDDVAAAMIDPAAFRLVQRDSGRYTPASHASRPARCRATFLRSCAYRDPMRLVPSIPVSWSNATDHDLMGS